MATKSRRMKRLEPAVTTLTFDLGSQGSTKYLDLAENLSIMNRKLIPQGQKMMVTGFTVLADNIDPTTVGSTVVKLSVIPDNWVSANAHTKGEALWNDMRDLVLDDNPSVKATWSDFKVFMDYGHANGNTFDPATGRWSSNLYVEDSEGTIAKTTFRDWDYAQVVMPQHDVNPATGLPDPPLSHTLHMQGPDMSASGSYIDGSFGIIEGYENSRALVQNSPDTPAGLPTTWMTLISDKGSQEPELTDNIDEENNTPPYSRASYPV